jgi:hypothetical protein
VEAGVDPERLGALAALKLRALVRGRWGEAAAAGTVARLPFGAAMAPAAGAEPVGWVLAESPPPGPGRRAGPADLAGVLGGALAWAMRAGLAGVHLLAAAGPADLARLAGAFAFPVTVWRVDGAATVPAEAAPAPPEPPVPDEVMAWAPVLAEAGAEPVAEHGRLLGEVLGLEVARVGLDDDGQVRLQVGVGRYERELYDARHGGQPPAAAIRAPVEVVRAERRPGRPPHPANQLAPERWLRAVLVAEPALVGAATLAPAPPPVERAGLADQVPAPAVGTDLGGRPLVVVAAARVGLGLVPLAADARAAAAVRLGLAPAEVRLVIAVPAGADHPVSARLAAALAAPAELVELRADWRAAGAAP